MFLQYIVGCHVIKTTDSLASFEEKVKSALSSIRYKWAIILVANYHSQGKSVKYILDNFSTIDILSKDIDFISLDIEAM